MRVLPRAWALLAILIPLLPSVAQAAPPKPLQARVDAIFQAWTKGNVPGCAAGVTQGGKWLAKGGYGSASIEHGVHITPNTVFDVASVSKQFTATALLRLMDGGKVRRADGWFMGYKAMFAWIPARRVAVFALCNLDDAPMSSIGNDLLYEALH